jgi:hypothetical protein
MKYFLCYAQFCPLL